MQKFFLILIAICAFSNISIASPAFELSSADKIVLKQALHYVDNKAYKAAHKAALKASDPDVMKLIKWLQFQRKYEGNTYKEIAEFIKENPTWPRIKTMRNRAEESLTDDIPATQIISFFKSQDPITGRAMRQLAEAMLTLGHKDTRKINDLLRKAWIQGDYKRDDEKSFLKLHKNQLSQEDHIKRIDRLLWQKKTTAAKRILHLVERKYKLLFRARILLIQNRRGVDYAISKVSDDLQYDPGFLYDRARWHKRRRNYNRLYDIILDIKEPTHYAKEWWKLRTKLARELIKKKQYEKAYNSVANHGNTPGGSAYAEAEWLAGWLALSFLHNPQVSYEHFYRLYNHVNYPVSKSRGAYWAGRSAEKNNNLDIASKWYKVALQNPTTFYGQMAYLKIRPNSPVRLPDFPNPTVVEQSKYKQNILSKMAHILMDANRKRLAEKFIIYSTRNAITDSEMALVSGLGKYLGHDDLSVLSAKHALRKGTILQDTGWPIISNLPYSGVEDPLILGIIRQESSFNISAQSSANARGMMQLIPSTAKRMASKLSVGYNRYKLLKDPNYNIRLGSHYLKGLIDRFNGSYILAIASYNAGPNNAKKWIKTYGDPRKISDPEDVLNWIESIPFAETRNYVQRVLENTQIYRHLLSGTAVALESDLTRVNTKISSN